MDESRLYKKYLWIVVGGFYNDRWDAGCVGFAYISKEAASANFIDVNEDNWYKRASKCIDGEVQVYDQYLTGEVYGYKLEKEVTIEEKCPHCNKIIKSYTEWIEEDSCWGFYGDCLEENGILEYIPNSIVFAD